MLTGRPPDFTNLQAASTLPKGSFVNVIGVVTDALPPKKSHGTDFMLTFTIADNTFGSIGLQGHEGLKARFFRANNYDLPPIQSIGDVVILRQIKMWDLQTLVSNQSTQWIVISKDVIPSRISPSIGMGRLKHRISHPSHPLSLAEENCAIELCNLNSRDLYKPVSRPGSKDGPQNASSTAGSGGNRGFALIKAIDDGCFYDLVAQVVKVYYQSERVELYVTDYTSNDLLFHYHEEEDESTRDGDEYGYANAYRRPKAKWPGPWGKMILTVSLFPPHSEWAQTNVQVEDFVSLRNVRIKFSKDLKFEGVMHTPRYQEGRVNIKVLKDLDDNDDVKDVLRRKRDYWKKQKKTNLGTQAAANGKKSKKSIKMNGAVTKHGDESSVHLVAAKKRKFSEPEAGDVDEGSEGDRDAKSKGKSRKRKKKKQKNQGDGKTELLTEGRNPSIPSTDVKPSSKSNGVTSNGPVPVPQLNSNIRCAHSTIPPSPLSVIKTPGINTNPPSGAKYTFPFRNVKSRTTVRIIDFFPPSIEDFAFRQKASKSQYDVLSDDEPSSESSDNSESGASDDTITPATSQKKSRWIWGFKLLLQDAHPKRQKMENGEDDRMWVTVGDKDAEFLLQLDAVDFRKDAAALNGLREKLFLLWGNLEETKEAQASEGPSHSSDTAQNLPFQCCLKEFGVKIRKKEKENAEGEGKLEDVVSDPEEQDDVVEGELGYKRSWIFERRWLMWGCSIV